MDIFQNVLEKAEQEGQIDPRLSAAMSGKKTNSWKINKFSLPPILMALPEYVIYDLQKIMENIRRISESRSAQIIGFTGVKSNQGTSTIISLLSILMADREKLSYKQIQDLKNRGDGSSALQHGVLLIDGQIHNPSIHNKFGLQQSGGLLEVLENEFSSGKLVKTTDCSVLKIVTSGIYQNFHLTQNHLDKLHVLLSNARRRVRYIFMDLPPVLNSPEGISLSRLCDGVVLIAQSGTIRREVVQEARQHLERAEVTILGGVLNRKENFIPPWLCKKI